MRANILVSCVIDGKTWLHNLGGIGVSYHSDTPFERLDEGYTTKCKLGIRFFTWCIVKSYYHGTLCITFHILIVSNDIIHQGIKVISWIWVVVDITMIPDYSDHK